MAQGARPEEADCVVLPGGFSYGDYLRCGALARFSPVMEAVIGFARQAGLVLGICNGFQVLCEAGLLPGALVRNRNLRFVCARVHLRLENAETPFTCRCTPGEVLTIPIKHGEGCYVADAATLEQLEENHQVVLRYVDASGRATPEANPNGSLNNIAGIVNQQPQRVRPYAASGARRRKGISAERTVSSCCAPCWPPAPPAAATAAPPPWPRDTDVHRRCPSTLAPVTEADALAARAERRTSTRASAGALGRAPNLVELGIYSVMWSEHCSYRIRSPLLKTLPPRRRRPSLPRRARTPACSISATAWLCASRSKATIIRLH